jgi:hypothetical protein
VKKLGQDIKKSIVGGERNYDWYRPDFPLYSDHRHDNIDAGRYPSTKFREHVDERAKQKRLKNHLARPVYERRSFDRTFLGGCPSRAQILDDHSKDAHNQRTRQKLREESCSAKIAGIGMNGESEASNPIGDGDPEQEDIERNPAGYEPVHHAQSRSEAAQRKAKITKGDAIVMLTFREGLPNPQICLF